MSDHRSEDSQTAKTCTEEYEVPMRPISEGKCPHQYEACNNITGSYTDWTSVIVQSLLRQIALNTCIHRHLPLYDFSNTRMFYKSHCYNLYSIPIVQNFSCFPHRFCATMVSLLALQAAKKPCLLAADYFVFQVNIFWSLHLKSSVDASVVRTLTCFLSDSQNIFAGHILSPSEPG